MHTQASPDLCAGFNLLEVVMKRTKIIVLASLVISTICLFGAMEIRKMRPVVPRDDTAYIESVLNQPRPATLAPNEPEPPRVFLDTTYVAPAGKTINVAAGGDVQAAINQARPGDVIMLQ